MGISKTVRFSFFLASFLLALSYGQAQELGTCGTPWGPESIAKFEEVRAFQSDLPENRDQITYYLKIQFHSVGDSDGSGHLPLGSFLDAFATINRHFAPYGLQFVMQNDVNRINNTSYYDHTSTSAGSQLMIRNKVSNQVNVFVVKNAANNAGYYLPSADAIAIRRSDFQSVQSSTLTHELGHFFTLPHTFLGWEGFDYYDLDKTPSYLEINGKDTVFVELSTGENCKTSGDRICDTKADYLSNRWYCSNGFSDQISDPTGKKFKVDGTNFMSYADDNCHAIFSKDQTDIINKSIRLSRSRYITSSSDPGEINFSKLQIKFPLEGQEVRHDDVYLEWEPVKNATKYVVEIYKFDILIDTYRIGEYIVNTNSVDLRDLDFDIGKKYYYRVRPYNDFHVASYFSDLHRFTASTVTDVDFIDPNNSVSIFPTLLNGEDLQVQFRLQAIQDLHLNISDIQGKLVWSDSQKIKNKNLSIETSTLPSGMYIFSIQTENKILNKRFIIQ